MADVELARSDDADPDRAPVPASPPPPPPARRRRRRRALSWVDVAGLVALLGISVAMRLEGLSVSLWLDEGISIGLASHPLAEIPGLLAQDGSPPLYYLLLHGWMQLFGDSAEAVRSLSLLFALAMVPLAYGAGRSLFGRGAGWIAAVLAATSPYLSYWGREARMYTLLALVSLVAVTAFVHVFAFRRRRWWLPLFAIGLTLVVYTHNWGLHLAAACGLAAALCWWVRPDRRQVAADAALGFGAVALLYAPWVPTLVSQVRETGAPWSTVPVVREAVSAVSSVLGDERVLVALLVAGAVPLWRLAARPRTAPGRAALVLASICGATVVLAWTVAQVAPGWSPRYFGIFLAPLLLVMALALSRAGSAGVVAFALVVLFWTQPLGRITGLRPAPTNAEKSNVMAVAASLSSALDAGDVILSSQLEQVPVLRYYFGSDLRYASPLGEVTDPTVVDWRHASERLAGADPAAVLDTPVGRLEPGQEVFLVCPPLTTSPGDPTWFRLMDLHCRTWRRALASDPSFTLVQGPLPPRAEELPGTPVFVLVYEKVG